MTAAIDVRRPSLEPVSLDEASALAKAAVASKLYAITSAEAGLMILLTGRDLGLSASQALRGIYVVNNKPVISADAMVAAVRRSGLAKSWRVVESTIERCTIETTREGEEHPERETFTLEDAKRAGLDRKDVWRAYPRDMLRHRCAAALVRRVYPDVVLGCYVPGEIDDPPSPAPLRVNVTASEPKAEKRKLSDEEKAARVAAILSDYDKAIAAGENADAAYDTAKRAGRDGVVAVLVQKALDDRERAEAERKRAEYGSHQAIYDRLLGDLANATTPVQVVTACIENRDAVGDLPESWLPRAWAESVSRWSAVGGEDGGDGLQTAMDERGES
jgi:hypothetical protein